MEDYRCIHCNEDIPPGGLRKNKLFCYTCIGFLHKRCSPGLDGYGCPKCGAKYCYPIIKITPDLASRFEAIAKKKTIFEFCGELPDIDSQVAEDLQASVTKEVSRGMLGALLGGLILSIGGLCVICVGFVLMDSIQPMTFIGTIMFFAFFFGFGGVCIWLGVRELTSGTRLRKPNNPAKLAECFYKQALLVDPIQPQKMLDLLSPASVSVIPKPWRHTLDISWKAARRTCREVFGMKEGNELWLYRIAVSPRPNSTIHDIVVEMNFEHWNDYDSWDLNRMIVVRFHNVAVMHNGSWKLLSPLPGQCRELALDQQSVADDV